MDIEIAQRHIQATLARMRACYLKPVFDEWAILALSASTGVLVAYHGPRPDAFRRSLAADAEPLRTATAGKQLAEGDLEFVSDGDQTRYDAFMKIGPTSYLVLNHTGMTMKEISAAPRWLGAQAVLFELSEKFRVDPLEV